LEVREYATTTKGIRACAGWFKQGKVKSAAVKSAGAYWIPVIRGGGGEGDRQLVQRSLNVFLRLDVARQCQPTPIQRGNPDIYQMDRRQFREHRGGHQSQRMKLACQALPARNRFMKAASMTSVSEWPREAQSRRISWKL
jgi:hypothetical protein